MFVGRYERKVQRGGWLRFPKDWLPFIGDRRSVFVMPDPDKNRSLLVVTSNDFNSEHLETRAKCAEKVNVTADGRMQISANLLAYAGIKNEAHFIGSIRTITLTD